MIYNSIADIFDANAEVHRRLTARLETLDATRAAERSAPDAWSVTQIVEHLALIQEQMTKLFQKLLQKAEAGRHAAAAAMPGLDERAGASTAPAFAPFSLDELIERGRDRKFDAPESVRPQGGLSLLDALARLRDARARFLELRPRLEQIDLASLHFPHPLFGPLNLYQWLAFIGTHEERHLRQIERLLESA